MRWFLLLALLLSFALPPAQAQPSTDTPVIDGVIIVPLGAALWQDVGAAPGQAYLLDTLTNNPACRIAPECGVLMQREVDAAAAADAAGGAPALTEPALTEPALTEPALLTLNGVRVAFNGTIFVQAVPGEGLWLNTLDGAAEVTAGGIIVMVPAGAVSTTLLDADGLVIGIPGRVVPYDSAGLRALQPALAALPQPVTLPVPADAETIAAAQSTLLTSTIVITGGAPDAGAPETGAPDAGAPETGAPPAAGGVDESTCGETIQEVTNPQPGTLAVLNIRFPLCIPPGSSAEGSFTYRGSAVRMELRVLETCASCGWSFDESYPLERGQTEFTLRLSCAAASTRDVHRFGIVLFDAQNNASEPLSFETVC